jgi:hypothetical protein
VGGELGAGVAFVTDDRFAAGEGECEQAPHDIAFGVIDATTEVVASII